MTLLREWLSGLARGEVGREVATSLSAMEEKRAVSVVLFFALSKAAEKRFCATDFLSFWTVLSRGRTVERTLKLLLSCPGTTASVPRC